MDTLWHDLRYGWRMRSGWRMMMKHPGFYAHRGVTHGRGATGVLLARAARDESGADGGVA